MVEAGMVVVEVISAAAGLAATLVMEASAAGVGILAVEEHQGMGKALKVPVSCSRNPRVNI
jgi:hypothetical protein